MTARPSVPEATRCGRVFEWAQAALLVANLAWTTLALGGYRPETFAITLTLTGASLVLLGAACFTRVVAPPLHAATWALGPFLVYGALNVAVITPVPWLGGRDWLNWANLVAVFCVALNGVRARAPRSCVFAALVALAIGGVFMSAYQCFARPGWLMLGRHQAEQFIGRGSGSFGIPNSFAGFLLLVIPATIALAFRRGAPATHRVAWSWIAGVLLFGLFLTLSRGAWLALGLAVVIGAVVTVTGSWRRRAAWAAAAALVFAGVLVVVYAASEPARGRLDRLVHDSGELSRPILWRAAWALFRSQPITGTGAGSYGVLFERHRPERFVDEPQWAHNELLNTLSDYGAIGALLLIGAGLWTWRARSASVRRIAAADWLSAETMRRALGIGVLAFLVQTFVDFHFKVPALGIAVAVVSALALGGEPEHRTGVQALSSRPARGFALACVLLGGAALLWARPALQGEGLRYRVREQLDRELAQTAPALPPLGELEAQLRRAVALAPANAQAWSDLSYVLALRATASPPQVEALAGPAEDAARRALRLSTVLPETWIRLGVALDMRGRRGEAEDAFQRALALAPHHGAGWYYYAYHLSLDTNARSAALRAIAKSLSLDPGNRAAEALRATITELR